MAAAVTVHYCTVLYSRGEYLDWGKIALKLDKVFYLQNFFLGTGRNLMSFKSLFFGSWKMGSNLTSRSWSLIHIQNSIGSRSLTRM